MYLIYNGCLLQLSYPSLVVCLQIQSDLIHRIIINVSKYHVGQFFMFITSRGRHGRDRMAVGFLTTCAINAYHHCCCEFESRSWRGVQQYVIQFVSGFLMVLWFYPPITEILLKVTFSTINPKLHYIHIISQLLNKINVFKVNDRETRTHIYISKVLFAQHCNGRQLLQRVNGTSLCIQNSLIYSVQLTDIVIHIAVRIQFLYGYV